MYCNIVLSYILESLFLLKQETLYSWYSNTVKASTEYHQLTEVTAYSWEWVASAGIWGLLSIWTWLSISFYQKCHQMLIFCVVSAVPRTSLMKICSTKAKKKNQPKVLKMEKYLQLSSVCKVEFSVLIFFSAFSEKGSKARSISSLVQSHTYLQAF